MKNNNNNNNNNDDNKYETKKLNKMNKQIMRNNNEDNKVKIKEKNTKVKVSEKQDKKTVKIDDDFFNLENLNQSLENQIKKEEIIEKDCDKSKNLLINNVDLLFSTNKTRENINKKKFVIQYSQDNIFKKTNFKCDLQKYKEKIKIYNDKLLSSIIDNCENLEKYYNYQNGDNDENKFRGEYLIYIKDLIEYIKMKELKSIIKEELNTYSNNSPIYNNLIDINNYDISNLNHNKLHKIKNFDNFYIKTKSKTINNNFIPKKRSI